MNDEVIYQDALAYLLGLEGIALLRAFGGEYDREFTHARFREIQELIERGPAELGDGVEARPISSQTVYAGWAPFYDQPGNELIDIEQPIVRAILDGLPVGVALDAACGTGRHATYLAELGHHVIGTDSSPEMLGLAHEKIPAADFHLAELDALPLDDGSVDLVLCALALVHVPDLEPVFAEFARVLRPGGHLVVSDQRGLVGELGFPITRDDDEGNLRYMPLYIRRTSEYLRVALPLGFEVRRCEEPEVPSPLITEDGVHIYDGERLADHEPGDPPYIWSLHAKAPAATNAAWHGKPSSVIWLFELRA